MKVKPHIYMNGSRNPGTILAVLRTGCNSAFPDADHCETCYYKYRRDVSGPYKLNMLSFVITACCNCTHKLATFTDGQWKQLANELGFDYGQTEEVKSEPKEEYVRIGKCKRCHEREELNSKKLCEGCAEWLERKASAVSPS